MNFSARQTVAKKPPQSVKTVFETKAAWG